MGDGRLRLTDDLVVAKLRLASPTFGGLPMLGTDRSKSGEK